MPPVVEKLVPAGTRVPSVPESVIALAAYVAARRAMPRFCACISSISPRAQHGNIARSASGIRYCAARAFSSAVGYVKSHMKPPSDLSYSSGRLSSISACISSADCPFKKSGSVNAGMSLI